MKKYAVYFIFLLTLLVLGLCMLFGEGGWPDRHSVVGRSILLLRFNRVCAGFTVGAALACAGTILQALLRNPLADPYVLGVSSGAGLGAGLAILTGFSLFSVPVSAFGFAVITLVLVYAFAGDGGRPSVYSLILSGVIISAVCSSLLMLMIALAPREGMHDIVWWLLGNLDIGTPFLLEFGAILIAAGFVVAWALAPALNALTLGEEMAHHLGVPVRGCVFIGLAAATLMTAAAVAMAGLIGFVGLIVPHAMRALLGPGHRRLIPASALAGGAFLAVCDAAARTVHSPAVLPVGVITALIGGPFFLIILRRRRKQGWPG
jgi:iron complex transport system permease protein